MPTTGGELGGGASGWTCNKITWSRKSTRRRAWAASYGSRNVASVSGSRYPMARVICGPASMVGGTFALTACEGQPTDLSAYVTGQPSRPRQGAQNTLFVYEGGTVRGQQPVGGTPQERRGCRTESGDCAQASSSVAQRVQIRVRLSFRVRRTSRNKAMKSEW
jgi:hypothetical protein